MKSLALTNVADALEHGYGRLHDPDDLYHSPRWLEIEQEIKVARPFHVLCMPQADRQAVAAGWGLMVDDSSISWPFMRVDMVLSRLLGERQIPRAAGDEVTVRSLLPQAYLGALRGGTTRLQIDRSLSGPLARRAIGEVLDGVETLAREVKIRSITWLYVPHDDALLRDVLRERGYAEFGPTLHASAYRVTGRTFDDYLSGFRQHRRARIRWERRKIASSDVELGVEALTPDLIEEMLPLEAQLFGKYGHESYPADTMRRQQRLVLSRFGRSIQVMTARAAGALRGYTAFIRMNHTLYSRDGGFDYAWQGRLPLYFELLFYSPIEFAMRSGIREINYSYGSEQTKASRGCDVARRVGYVKALDPGADGDLRRLCAKLCYPA